MTDKLRLATRYVSPRHLATFSIFLNFTRKHSVPWDHTDVLKAADAILIDIDVSDGRVLLNALAAQKGRQALIAYGDNQEYGDHPADFPLEVLHLHKPPNSGSFLRVLEQAARRCAVEHPSGHTAAAPASSLLDLLVRNPDKIVAVSGAESYIAVFDKKRRCFYRDEAMTDIHGLLLAGPGAHGHIGEIDRERLDEVAGCLIREALDPPVWSAMLSVSNGNLYADLPLDGFYKLRHWPSLYALGFQPSYMRLATALRRGCTLHMLADVAQEPIASVIDFVNACFALDYLEPVAVPVQGATPASAGASEKQSPAVAQKASGLFSRIRRRLGI